MKVVICSGRKGGVGKSFCAAAVTGVLQEAGIRPLLVDGDFQTKDFARRHEGDEKVLRSVVVDLKLDAAWHRLCGALEKAAPPIVVINLGADVAGADKDQVADFSRAMAALGADLSVFWVGLPTVECVEHTADSLANGLLSAAPQKTLVENLCGGYEVEDFSIFDDVRSQFGAVVVLPELAHPLPRLLAAVPMRPEVAKLHAENMFGRLRYSRWWESVRAALAPALGVSGAEISTEGKVDGAVN